MAINLGALVPNEVSRDLKGKIVTIYGEPKVGKTTTATKFPKSLLVAFEKGYNALPGIMVQPVTKWKEFKDVLKELAKEENKHLFATIVIDTADLAFDAAERFVCNREGVDAIGDIPYGAGYKMLKNEFNDALRSIPMMDYGLVMISHAVNATFTDESGAEYSKIVPTLPKAPRAIVLSMSDVIGFAKNVEDENGQQSVLFLRGTPRFEAGSRFKHTPNYIKFDYDSLVNAIAEAIEKEASQGGAVTDAPQNVYEVAKEVPFEEIKAEVDKIIEKLVSDVATQEANAVKIKKIIETHVGKGKLLKDLNGDQRDHLELILDDLKAI
jgi:hypothetical protein